MGEKLVSVYIPTHFRPELLDRAIRSIFNQTYKNIEVVVCLDGYCIESINILDKWVKEGYKIKYHYEKTAKGACFCRNKAIAMCDGDFITGLDDDDYFEENRVRLFLDKYKYKDQILYTNYKVKSSLNKMKISPSIDVKDRLYEFNYIGNQIFFHSSIKRDVIFDELMPAWQDYEAWLSLYEKGYEFHILDEPSYIVDLTHPHERITKNTNKVVKAYFLIIDKHKKFINEPYSTFLKYSLYRYPNVDLSYNDALKVFSNMGAIKFFKLIAKRIFKS